MNVTNVMTNLSAATDTRYRWTDVAYSDALDTQTVIGDRLAAVVGTVHSAVAASDCPDASDALVDRLGRLAQRSDFPSDPDDTLNDLVGLIGSVHDDCRNATSAVVGVATITALVHLGATIAVVHVGDAAAMRLRSGAVAELTPLTQEHTLAAELRAAGRHPNARAGAVLTRFVGAPGALAVDVTQVPVETGRMRYAIVGRSSINLAEVLRRGGAATTSTATLAAIRDVVSASAAAIVVEVDA